MNGRYGLQGIAPGEYVTASGRYRVERDEHYENECECIHCLDSRVHDCRSKYPGQRTEIAWIVWDTTTDDYATGTGALQFDTMREAAAFALASPGA